MQLVIAGRQGCFLCQCRALPSPGEKVPPKGADVEFGRKCHCFMDVKDVVVRNVSERTSVFLHFRQLPAFHISQASRPASFSPGESIWYYVSKTGSFSKL